MTSERSLWVRMKDNNYRRYWIGIVNSVLLFLLMPLRFLAFCASNMKYYESIMHQDFLSSAREILCQNVLGPNEYMLIYLVFAAVLSGVEGYCYLYHMQKVDMLHSQPVSCRRRFFSIYFNGVLYFLLPYLANVLVAILVAGIFHVLTGTLLSAFLLTVIYNCIGFLAFYHTVILAVVLTGNYIACFFGIAAIFGTEWAFRSLFFSYCTDYLKTFSYRSEDQMMNPVLSVLSIFLQAIRQAKYPNYAPKEALFTATTILSASYKNMLILILIGMITLLIAYLAYYHRPVEAAGKPVVIDMVKPLAKILAIVLVSLSMGWGLGSISGNNVWIVSTGLIIGAIIAQCIMEIIYEARLSAVLERLWQFAIGVVIVAIMFLGFKLDIFRYDQSVPKPESVESFAVLFGPLEMDSYYMGEDKTFRYVERNMQIKDTMLLEQLAAADYYHQTGEKELYDEENEYSTADVIYSMKNGGKKYRTYFIDMDKQQQLMDVIFAKKEYQTCVYPIMNEHFLEDAKGINLIVSGITKEYTSLSETFFRDLKQAYQEDLKLYNYSMVSQSHQDGVVFVADHDADDGSGYSLPVYDCFERVNGVLDKYGFPINEQIDATNINKIELSYSPVPGNGQARVGESDTSLIIWEEDKIANIMEYAEETTYGNWWKPQEQYYNDIFMYATLDSGNAVVLSFKKEKGIPGWLEKELHMNERKTN